MTPYEYAKADIGSRDGGYYLREAGWPHLPPAANWCSAAMRVWHASAGIYLHSVTPAARSWHHVGEPVELADAREGDVVVLWRGKPGGWQGHCMFYVGHSQRSIRGLGGNTRGAVAEGTFPFERLLGIRRM